MHCICQLYKVFKSKHAFQSPNYLVTARSEDLVATILSGHTVFFKLIASVSQHLCCQFASLAKFMIVFLWQRHLRIHGRSKFCQLKASDRIN